jgi:polyisoprenyl-phosphate glycosyltransferase
MKKNSLSIVIPTYNGAGSLIKLINELYDVFDFIDFEIIIINDSSPDLTDIRFEKNIPNLKKFKYILLEHNVGEDRAVEIGLEYVEYDSIMIIDDDYQHTPSACKEMYYNFINSDLDVLYSKYKEKKHPFIRNFGSKIFNLLYLFKSNTNIKYLSSFKIFSEKLNHKYLESNNTDYIHIDDFILSNNYKLNFFELYHNDRFNNKSNYNFMSLIKVFFIRVINRFNNLKKIFTYIVHFFIFLFVYKIIITILNIYLFNVVYPKGYPTLLSLVILTILISLNNFLDIKKKFSKISIKKFLKSKFYKS